MAELDIGAIVPSSRDALQAIATHKKALAIVGAVAPEDGAAAARRLDDLGVRALASTASDAHMAAIAAATKSLPTICLAPVATRDEALRARSLGADAVCVARGLDDASWSAVAEAIQATHMLAIATASDAGEIATSERRGARAVLLTAPTTAGVLALAATKPRGVALLASPADADLDALRTLFGHVDAVVVAAPLEDETGFGAFVPEVDP
ncbi:MAG TPA: hypothetical protein VGM56_24475 [Byssovorax sp.]|jgi:hypothetical protein